MKELPILFSKDMVQAIMEGRKNQTRRTSGLKEVNEIPDNWLVQKCDGYFEFEDRLFSDIKAKIKPRYQKWDHIWVRETYRYAFHYGFTDELVEYKAGGTNCHCEIPDMDQLLPSSNWKPSIHMFKEDARIWLECTTVRCERLFEISEQDAINEGITVIEENEAYFDYEYDGKNGSFVSARGSFFSLWKKINGKESVELNPWVFIYDFVKIEKP